MTDPTRCLARRVISRPRSSRAAGRSVAIRTDHYTATTDRHARRWLKSSPFHRSAGEDRIDGLGAFAPELACAALFAAPDPFEPLLRAIEQDFVIGENAHLEISASFRFCAEARAREIRAPE